MKKTYAAVLLLILAAAGTAGFFLLVKQGKEKGKDPDSPLTLPLPAGFDVPEYVRGRVIVIGYRSEDRPRIQRTRDSAASLAIKLHKKISEGKISFEEAARQYSDAPSAEQGGELGFVRFEDVAHMYSSFVLFQLRPGHMSKVKEGKSAFFIYKSIDFERKYYRIIMLRYSDSGDSLRSRIDAMQKMEEIIKSIRAGDISFEEAADQYSEYPGAPGGYIGNVILGTGGAMFDTTVEGLEIGEMSDPFDDGRYVGVIKRCRPEQFTFSYIVFDGDTQDVDIRRKLIKQARRCIEQIRGSREKFYRYALRHYDENKWDSVWYKVSKGLVTGTLSPEVYQFLTSAKPGDISEPMVFDNGVFIIMKEEFITLE